MPVERHDYQRMGNMSLANNASRSDHMDLTISHAVPPTIAKAKTPPMIAIVS